LRKDPLSPIIYHNTLGSNVTSYVLVDSNRTNYFWSMPFFLDIFPYYFFDGKVLGLQNDAKEPQIEDLQLAYQRMYINVYFHPVVRYFERLYEKIVQLLIENGTISKEKMWDLEDFKLYQLLKDDKQANGLFVRIQNEELDKKFLSLNYNSFGALSERFAEFCSNPLNLSRLERKISAEFGCDPDQVTCVLTAVLDMIIPEDVFIFEWGESVFQRQHSFPVADFNKFIWHSICILYSSVVIRIASSNVVNPSFTFSNTSSLNVFIPHSLITYSRSFW